MSEFLTQDDLDQIEKHVSEYGEAPDGLIDPLIAMACRSLELEAENARLRGLLAEIAGMEPDEDVAAAIAVAVEALGDDDE